MSITYPIRTRSDRQGCIDDLLATWSVKDIIARGNPRGRPLSSTSMPTPTIRLLSPGDDAHLVPYLAAIHAACIHHDKMVATFLPPLDNNKLLAYWREMIRDVGAGTRLVVIQLDESEPGSVAKGAELKGVVMLRMPQTETFTHQGHLEKLMVSPSYRQRGAARAMIRFLETEAVHRGRKLIMLSTEVGSPAETIYPKLGYAAYGRVPRCCIGPSGNMVDDVFFYKQLS
ncbi:acyl-CoA N-acyltransferase [Xylaria acuta]|nr:acyl-CoA N-acyltransferase [Xylaria acuta]